MDFIQFHELMNNHYYRANCYHTMQNPDKDATSGNHHVINATYHLINKKLNKLYPIVEQGRGDLNHHVDFMVSTMVAPGLYARHPNKLQDEQRQDDYVGIITSNNIYYGPFSSTIYKEGKDRKFLVKYYYDHLKNPKPSIKSWFGNWFGKYPWMVALIKYSGTGKINTFNRLGYCAYLLSDIYFNRKQKDESSRILMWISNSVMKGESSTIDSCISKWEKNIERVYPDGKMGEVLGKYHGRFHPFSIAMWGKL